MTKSEYKQLRRLVGTQTDLAKQLGLDQKTISNRESGRTRITKEAEIAIKEITKCLK